MLYVNLFEQVILSPCVFHTKTMVASFVLLRICSYFGTKFWLSEKGLFGRAGFIPTFQFMELQGIVGFYRDFNFFTCCKVIVRFE